jgi:glycosyltransferase involved in cell wall biosynthesis
MRVVHVNCARDPQRRTGTDLLDAWPTLVSVAAAVKDAGGDVHVVQSSARSGYCERAGVRCHFVAEPWAGMRPAAGYAPWRIARAVKALQPDVIHVNGFGFPFHTRALCALGAPVLVQDHADNPNSRMGALRGWGMARVDGAAFTAAGMSLPFFSNRTFRPGMPVFSIPESSTHFQSGDGEQARAKTGIYGNPAVLSVGHLNENKDPITILRAIAQAAPQLPGLHLWLCYGNAPLHDSLNRIVVSDPALASRVHFLGAIPHEQMEWAFRAADFFISGSRREGSGYALLEALACGAIPVVTDIPSFRALTASGKVGALCHPGDAHGFANAFVSLANSDMDAARAKAIAYFNSELSFAALGRKLLAAYRELAELRVQSGMRSR